MLTTATNQAWITKFLERLNTGDLCFCKYFYKVCGNTQVAPLTRNFRGSVKRAKQASKMGGQVIIPVYYNLNESKSFQHNSIIAFVVGDDGGTHVLDPSGKKAKHLLSSIWMQKNYKVLNGDNLEHHLFMGLILNEILKHNNFFQAAREIEENGKLLSSFTIKKGIELLNLRLSVCNS